jgi:two-component system nitrate/nitrite response regulator NarL
VIRIAIVDDHALVAETLAAALAAHGLDVLVVTVGPAAELADAVLAAAPDLVLLDLDLGEYGDSTPVLATLTAAGIRVLTVTGVDDRVRLAQALEAGAIGYQPKSAGFAALVAAAVQAATATGPIDEAHRRELLSELDAHRKSRALADAPFQRLTVREAKTLQALGDGMSVQEIASSWVVSEATVRTHVRAVLTKVGAKSQLAAVAMASRCGWLSYARR